MSSQPGGREGPSSLKEPAGSPGIYSGAICTCQGFHTTLSQMGLEISDLAQRKEVALLFSHASAHELRVGLETKGR